MSNFHRYQIKKLLGELSLHSPRQSRNRRVNGEGVDNGVTALHRAVERIDTEAVKQLLERGVRVFVECKIKRLTPLAYLSVISIYDSDPQALEIVKMILSQGVTLKTINYQNLLRYGNKEMVRIVLQSNIDLFGRDKINQTPVHYLAVNKRDGVIDELHGKMYDVNAVALFKKTPLRLAVSAGLPYTVEFLLKNGANPNSQHRGSRSTPLSLAFTSAYSGSDITTYRDIIDILIKYGADPQLEIKEYGSTVLSDIFVAVRNAGDRYALLEPFISYLALIEKQGMTIDTRIVGLIDANPIWKEFFETCRQQLNALESIKINDSLSLYQLLIINDTNIQHYARDQNILLKIMSISENEESYRPYHLKIQKRFEQAVKIANLRKEAALAFCDLNCLYYNVCHLFVDQIIGYLSCIDLQRLCEI